MRHGVRIFTFHHYDWILTVHSLVYDIGMPGWALKLRVIQLFLKKKRRKNLNPSIKHNLLITKHKTYLLGINYISCSLLSIHWYETVLQYLDLYVGGGWFKHDLATLTELSLLSFCRTIILFHVSETLNVGKRPGNSSGHGLGREYNEKSVFRRWWRGQSQDSPWSQGNANQASVW